MEKYSLIDLFKMMHTRNASDIHIKADAPPAFRMRGELIKTKLGAITEKQIRNMLGDVISKDMQETFEREGNLDTAVSIPRVGRFRVNVFRQKGTTALVARRISFFIPDYESLSLPKAVSRVTGYVNGLVLVTGPTGSGKSSTLAAMINQINKTRNCHILCIEDPIEFLYQDEMAVVTQREIGIDVVSFKDALKYAMREDPDVILVGEMRDEDTVEFAFNASETGHLIFGTLHSSNAVQTVQRILNFFPQSSHAEARKSLSAQLKAIVSQMLIPACREDVHIVPACEILFVNPTIQRLIAEGQDEKILRAMKAGKDEGMVDFDQALVQLVHDGFVKDEVALQFTDNPQGLEMKLKGFVLSDEGGLIT